VELKMANDKKKTPSTASKTAKASDAPAKARPAASSPTRMPVNVAQRQRAESLGFLGITTLVLVILNVIGYVASARWDVTPNRAYSLSQGSIDAVSPPDPDHGVHGLDETLTITAYFSANLPAPFNATERYVRDILSEYEAASDHHVVVHFVSPDSDEERHAAEQAGVTLVQHQHIDHDAVSVVEGYRGLVFEYLGNHQTIPVIQPDTQGLEYSITMAIKELTGDELHIGVLGGHEGPSLTKGLSTFQRMLPTYEISEVSATEPIDTNLRALLIVDPRTEITEAELRNIDAYVMQGGSLGVFGGSMVVDIEAGPDLTAEASHSGVNRLLERWGVSLGENIVADMQCGRVPMRTPIGIPIPVAYPPAPIVTFSDEERASTILFRLESTPLFFVSSVETTEVFRNLGGQIVMRSSGRDQASGQELSWMLEGSSISLRIRDPREWGSTMGGQSGPFALAASIDAELPSAFAAEGGASTDGTDSRGPAGADHSDGNVRVLVVGTSTSLRDEFLPQGGQVSDAELAGAMAFPLNSVDWLAQDEDLIAIRAKSIEEPALEVPQGVTAATEAALEDAERGDEAGMQEALEERTAALEAWESRKSMYRWGNTILIPLAFAGFGVIRWQMRARKKASLKA
jgi:ABC-type uncharacterized transport system involved in gliding motility auxiliary subunit